MHYDITKKNWEWNNIKNWKWKNIVESCVIEIQKFERISEHEAQAICRSLVELNHFDLLLWP